MRSLNFIFILIYLWNTLSFAISKDVSSSPSLVKEYIVEHEFPNQSGRLFSESWNEIRGYVSDAARVKIDSFVAENPNFRIPKMNFKKTLNSKGDTQLKIDFKQNKETIVMTLSENDQFPAIVNDIKFTSDELRDFDVIMEKLASGQKTKNKRSPASESSEGFWSNNSNWLLPLTIVAGVGLLAWGLCSFKVIKIFGCGKKSNSTSTSTSSTENSESPAISENPSEPTYTGVGTK